MPSPMEKRNLTSQECCAGSVPRFCRGGGTLHLPPLPPTEHNGSKKEPTPALREHASSLSRRRDSRAMPTACLMLPSSKHLSNMLSTIASSLEERLGV